MPFDELSEEPLVSPDTKNATKFHPDEAPAGQEEYWKRLAGYNSGVYNGFWEDATEIRRLDNLGVFDSISSQLELTTHQKRMGRMHFDELNIREIGYSVELISFAVCAVVAAEDGRRYSPRANPENTDSEFVRIADSLDLRPRLIERAIRVIKEEVNA
jgi:hypothetical protein